MVKYKKILMKKEEGTIVHKSEKIQNTPLVFSFFL
jgi:hypothetical protein